MTGNLYKLNNKTGLTETEMIILTQRIISDKLGLKGFEVRDWKYNIESEVITNLLDSKGKVK